MMRQVSSRVSLLPEFKTNFDSNQPISYREGYIITDKVQNAQIKSDLDMHCDNTEYVCLFGLSFTSQSTIFQSCRDGATASWVLPVLFGR